MNFKIAKLSRWLPAAASCGGMMALPSILMISALVFVAGMGLASRGFFENIASFSDADSKKALFAAEAGAEDAFKRIVRNKKCNDGGTPSCASYSLATGEGTASVVVSGTGENPKTIVSSGTVRGRQKKIQATVNFDANNKAILGSWQEITE